MNTRMAGISAGLFALLALAGTQEAAKAHHSYAMYGTGTAHVAGTVAKLEWRNPHTYLWVYVRDPKAAGGFILYAFENGAPNVLERRGWSKDLLRPGEPITVTYWPLKDGRPGGHLESATLSDGRVLPGAGGPRRADGDAPVRP
jgi:hypothetical protein